MNPTRVPETAFDEPLDKRSGQHGTHRRDHLPRPESPPRPWATSLLAITGSTLLLIGVPYALLRFVGNPLPSQLPDRSWLTAPVTPQLMINILAVLVWVVWAHFVICFISEWRTMRRGVMPARIAFGGGSQLLARQLVATILLLGGGTTLAQGLVSGPSDFAPEAEPPATPAASATSHQPRAEPRTQRGVGVREEPPPKYISVEPPEGRHHDTLWDIAERTLGDPFRYREIFELNRDRIMPDGRRVQDADLIHPGWELLLPKDAKGPGVRSTAPRPLTGPTPGSTPDVPAESSSGAATSDRDADRARPEATDARGVPSADATGSPRATGGDEVAGEADPDGGRLPWEQLLLGGGLILAGLVRVLRARRGPFGPVDAASAELAAASSARRAEFVDAGLRGLSAARTAAGLGMPELRYALVDDERLVLHLSAPSADGPAAPWEASEDHLTWSLPCDAEFSPSATAAPAPYPSLTAIATMHGFEVLLDLESAPGMVALTGDPEVSRGLAMAMALDLATHPWADGLDVVMVGFGETFGQLDGRRVRVAESLDQVVDTIVAADGARMRTLDELGFTGVLHGRQLGATKALDPVVIFLSGPPTSEQAQRLASLTAGERSAVSVVCVGDPAGARWRLKVDAQGGLESVALGLSGTARRLGVAAIREIRTQYELAGAARAVGETTFAETPIVELAQPASSVAPEPAGSPGNDPRHDPAHDPAAVVGLEDFQRARLRLRLLGRVELVGADRVPPDRRGPLTETVALVALHPEGIHQAVLRSSLWPRGVESDVVRSRIDEVSAWLGRDEHGVPRLRLEADGRFRLSIDLVSDYAVLRSSVRVSPSGDPAELDRLLGVLRLGCDEVFSGVEYPWLTFSREARIARLLVAAVARRAAELATHLGADDRAVEALELGIGMVPTCEELWRMKIKLMARHQPSEVAPTIRQMHSALLGRGVRIEPATEALVRELVPDRDEAVGG
ncbi:MAG: LysM peptidoglycan-binding domain-containing protein [Nocardioides sp.]